MELSGITEILGGQKVLRKRIENPLDLIELSNEGVTKDALSHLAKKLHLSMSQMAELLPVAKRTIERKVPGEPFKAHIAERIILIAQVAVKGIKVFEDEENFRAWLNLPHTAFAKKTPIDLLASSFGAAMVLDELGRIEYGVFS